MIENCRHSVTALVWAAISAACIPAGAGENDVFEPPVRLMAGGAYIDAGEALGHCGPCLADVDGDGARDLVVGDFSGQFRLYRNIGSDELPKFATHTYLEAGGEIAKVPVY